MPQEKHGPQCLLFATNLDRLHTAAAGAYAALNPHTQIPQVLLSKRKAQLAMRKLEHGRKSPAWMIRRYFDLRLSTELQYTDIFHQD